MKKLISMLTVIFLIFYVCGYSVAAAESGDENEWELIDEEFRNLKFELPEFVEVEEEESLKINTLGGFNALVPYVSITEPYGVYRGNVHTNSDLITSMNETLNSTIKVEYTDGPTYNYNFSHKLLKSFVMPGMRETNVCGSLCRDMIPQGLTYHDGYYFITAYCANDYEHNSVVYAINANTGAYVTTLVLTQGIHAGGITYSNGYLWIASDNKVFYYNASEIIYALAYATQDTTVKSIYLENYTRGEKILNGQNGASFITTYGNLLCVGEFVSDSEYASGVRPRIVFFSPNTNNSSSLNPMTPYEIPKIAQGVEFYKNGNNEYMVISTSHGRENQSTLYVYKKKNGVFENTKTIKLTSMAEEILTHGNYTYIVFESCAKKYREDIETMDVTGKVCGFSNLFIYK